MAKTDRETAPLIASHREGDARTVVACPFAAGRVRGRYWRKERLTLGEDTWPVITRMACRAAGHGYLTAVLRGLRHLYPCGEPARVFTELAGVCVPALCDECVIWISEQGQHPYRIRRAGPAVPADASAILPSLLATARGAGTTILSGSAAGAAMVEIADHAVIARFVNPPGVAPTTGASWSAAGTPVTFPMTRKRP